MHTFVVGWAFGAGVLLLVVIVVAVVIVIAVVVAAAAAAPPSLSSSSWQPQAEQVGSSDVVLTEKQFRSTHTVRWTVGFVELVADLAA